MRFDHQLLEHIPRLRRYARALTGDAVRADDLVQDTLERAWRKQRLWQRGSNLRAWLFTVMHNVHANQQRAAAHGEEVDYMALNLAGPDSSVEESVGVRDLLRGIAQLPLEMREVLLLVGLEQFSYKEAAKMLNIPLGTVMSRLSRARERLRAWQEARPGSAMLKVVR
ncbi:MAG: sigma-70 family RNA polymerase sigma factor [Gammaproteobacteria bacterium]|nr:sigma-70 family RNA polymerase sigma factor [Gammaproteobacteria bacterium]MCP5418741.1 sigma-70 family RNA polymerase sigma factor [Chromatiaceae bacterium]